MTAETPLLPLASQRAPDAMRTPITMRIQPKIKISIGSEVRIGQTLRDQIKRIATSA